MSKRKKRFERLMNGPPRSDITFDEVDTILRDLGFTVTNVDGSHNKYECNGHWKIIVRPHGGKKELHRTTIKRIRELINEAKGDNGDIYE